MSEWCVESHEMQWLGGWLAGIVGYVDGDADNQPHFRARLALDLMKCKVLFYYYKFALSTGY